MSDVFSGAPENCDAAAERRRPKRTQKAEGDTMAVGRIGDNVITLGGIFPSLLWMEGRKGSCTTTSESDSSWRRCRPDSSPEIEIATFPPSLSLLFSSTSGPKNYRTSFSLRRAIRAEVSCLTFVLLRSPEKVESVVTTRDRGRKQEGELQPLLAFTLQDPKATCGRNVVRDQSCLTTQV